MTAKDETQIASGYDHDEELSQNGEEKRRASSHVPRNMPESLRGMEEKELEALGRKATFKIDIIVMPCLVVMYVLNYLDRQNIASARLAGLPEDLNINATQYQTCVSILFVGYILMQVPSNMILGRIKWPGIYINLAMAAWGVVSACMAAVHSYPGLLLARFFIGFVEAVFFPGALYYLSLFYNRQQYALRAAILYSGSQLGNAFGGLFAIAILQLDGAHGIAGWRWLFIVEGALTVGIALIFACILPNSPRGVRGLTETEKDWQQWNYEKDQGQSDDGKEIGPGKGFKLALIDPKMWLMLVCLYAIYISAAVTNFFPSVVETLGYSRNATYGLTAPPFCLCVILMMLNGWLSDKRRNRYWHIVLPLCLSVVANIIAVSSLNTAARYVAMMLMPGSAYMASTVLLSWVAGSLNQPAIKRACAIAFINAVCNTPNIWTSYLYTGAPRYLVAFLVNMAASGVAIAVATVTMFYLRRQNAKLDQGRSLGKSGLTGAQVMSGFRYML